MSYKKDIGMRLRFSRERKGYQQQFIAKKIGVHGTTLSKIELGINEPDSEKLKLLCEIYEVNPLWILYGEDYEKVNFDLTEQEQDILALFNTLSDEGKKWFLDTIQMLKKK